MDQSEAQLFNLGTATAEKEEKNNIGDTGGQNKQRNITGENHLFKPKVNSKESICIYCGPKKTWQRVRLMLL